MDIIYPKSTATVSSLAVTSHLGKSRFEWRIHCFTEMNLYKHVNFSRNETEPAPKTLTAADYF